MTDQIHNLDIDTAAVEWLAAKKAEADAVKRRRKLEDHMLSLIGILRLSPQPGRPRLKLSPPHYPWRSQLRPVAHHSPLSRSK